MTPSNPKTFLIVAGTALAWLASTPAVRATNFDTAPSWDGVSAIQYFGPASADDTPTFGETFVAPSDTTVLDSFTFYMGSATGNSSDPTTYNFLPDAVGDQYTVQGEVFNWTGNLLADNPNQGTPAPALFTSAPMTITSDGGFDAVTVNTGGLNLIAGNDYVVDLTDLTGPSLDFGIFEFDYDFGVAPPGDGGGGFASSNFGTTGFWDDGDDTNPPGNYGDLIFQADFSSSNGGNNSAPDAASTAVLFGLGVAALSILARRQRAVSHA